MQLSYSTTSRKPIHTPLSFAHYPQWAQEVARKYLGKTVSQFILHGNIRDQVMVGQRREHHFMRFDRFLSDELFAAREIVLFYDRSSGVHFRDKASMSEFNKAVSGYDAMAGTDYARSMPVDPVRVFTLLEHFFRVRLAENRSIACIIDYTETVVPANEAGMASAEDRNALVFLQKWSHDPLFLAADFTVVMLSENLADLHRALVQNPYTAPVKVGLPDRKVRKAYIDHQTGEGELKKLASMSARTLAQQTAGLSLINIRALLSGAREIGYRITPTVLSRNKKEQIEAEAHDLLEFVDSRDDLDAVAGHHAVKQRLRQAASALQNGRPEVLPMGYLVCGAVGTGKTWLVTCFAGEVGIPMVKLKNFRSQWQGVTEGNLEKILTLIQAMAPVAVMIDEADAYLGDRQMSGDSGVSARVFSRIAQFMSDTSQRGRVLWFLMTARPDLMPVDLKRQGRAEEHLPLFLPSSREERRELFEAMKQKTGIELESDTIPEGILQSARPYSGADMEAMLTRAMFRAAAENEGKVQVRHLEEALQDFVSPAYPEEIELQTLAAIQEATSRFMLPEDWQDADRDEIADRLEELRWRAG